MRPLHYIEVDGKPQPVADVREWARWFETADRTVVKTYRRDGVITISTVFLGSDHGFSGGARPVLYETMVFWPGNDDLDLACQRYCTRGEARKGHAAMVARVDDELARMVAA